VAYAQLTEIRRLCILLHMPTVVLADVFSAWLARLKDIKGRARIAARIERVRLTGNFGDARSLGNGVSELRIDYGPGYRLYFTLQGDEIVILLCAGDKGSQDRDIRRAIRMAEDYL
jgi:putative addiction module killer protein